MTKRRDEMTDTLPPFPADIDPESGCRLPLPRREALDDAAAELFDQLETLSGRSLVGLNGPGGIRLHSPYLAVLSQPLNRYLRFETALPGRIRELAILVVARAQDCQFEWVQHEGAALKEGLSAETIDIVRHRRPTDGLDETEAAVIALGRAIFEARRVGTETYASALVAFGARDLVDLVSLMGLYAATAALLTAFDMQLRPGQEPGLPIS